MRSEVSGVNDRTMEWVMVEACLRDGEGGSPTAVVPDGDGLTDADLARIPERAGSSHVAVIDPHRDGRPGIRFFTREGELPNCGHGTVAAIALLAHQGPDGVFEGRIRVAGRDVEACGTLRPGPAGDHVFEAWFHQGHVARRDVTSEEQAAFLAVLGLPPDALHPDEQVVVTSPGRERLLIPVADRVVLAGIRPDPDRLAAESHRYGQLGCFVYVLPTSAGRAAGRMFAPAVGVPEDVANANSTGCLAAHLLLSDREPTIAVDQGDALGRPSTVYATAVQDERGISTRVGGTARVVVP